jgi:hypothetical protein
MTGEIGQEFNINQKFEFLGDLTKMVVKEITPSIIVSGSGGLGKTHSVLQCVEECGLQPVEWVHFKGYSTARGLYNTLYDNNGKLIIFDDCDSILEDKVSLNILKSALDSYESRKISWMAKMNKNDEYPQQFEFTGRVIFISNKSKDSIDGAVLSRSITVDLSMTVSEKIERMEYILPKILPSYSMEIKEDALRFLDSQKEGEIGEDLNLRTLIMVAKMRKAFPDKWVNLASYMINS